MFHQHEKFSFWTIVRGERVIHAQPRCCFSPGKMMEMRMRDWSGMKVLPRSLFRVQWSEESLSPSSISAVRLQNKRCFSIWEVMSSFGIARVVLHNLSQNR
ncbi:hypothetical protein NPIL_514331 [Nephila pilipes]|uniref:Uncharacterized protein n=1 Tax=Nephila pilipes TaxID=299642 RepID=A0A8X6QPE0_NEPPI|nr:hypothetical protein NPIL_514331 [Nephila pilipes]